MSEPVVVHPPNVLEDPVRTALEYLSEGFQIISPDWKYLYVNPAAARHGRRDASALIGTPMVQAYPGIDHTELFDVLRRCMEQRTSAVVENEFTFPDGHDAVVRAAHPSGAGRHLHLLGRHRAS